MYTIREAVLTVAALAVIGCSNSKVADVSDSINSSLKQQGYTDVSAKDDTSKGVVTLTGKATSDDQKTAVEGIAKSLAGTQVVANEIAVLPPGEESTAKSVNSDIDKGIENNLSAALTQNALNKDVDYSVKNGVVKLTGTVDSQARRSKAQNVAAGVPNVQQVVNEVQVKDQRATSTN